MLLLLGAGLAFVLSAMTVRASIPWLARQGAVAHENNRTMHKGAVPKGGGLPLLASGAVALTMLLGLKALAALNGPADATAPGILATYWPVGLGVLVLALLSWRDDLGHVPAGIRLPIHLLVAAVTVWALPTEGLYFQGWLPFWLDRALAALALAWMMNLFNFMDGINGIAGAEVIAICFGYLVFGAAAGVALTYTPLAVVALAASAGFLIHNARNSPRVFLGDVGSIPLGFLMGVLMLDLAGQGHWAAALILPGYFLSDATLTLLKRLLRGERVWEAHRSHAYQRAAAAIGKHLPVVAIISVANAVLIAAAVVTVGHLWTGIAIAGATVAALLITLTAIGRSRSSGSGP